MQEQEQVLSVDPILIVLVRRQNSDDLAGSRSRVLSRFTIFFPGYQGVSSPVSVFLSGMWPTNKEIEMAP